MIPTILGLMTISLLSFVALSLCAATPAIREERRQDLICVAAFWSMVEDGRANGDQERARHATAAAHFFIDRLVRREPKLDLPSAMAELASEIGQQPISDYMPGCIEERKRGLEAIMEGGAKK